MNNNSRDKQSELRYCDEKETESETGELVDGLRQPGLVVAMFLFVLAIGFSLFGGYDLDREWLLISATLVLSGGRWAGLTLPNGRCGDCAEA